MAHSFQDVPPLDALQAFEVAARAGSFSAAADQLHLTHGAVSRRIARLEDWFGHKLFERRGRGVVLTPEGQRLSERTGEAFALIAETPDRWTEARGAAIVRLSTVPSVCASWLLPRLEKLEQGQEGGEALRIEILIDQKYADLQADGVDLAIRCGRGTVPGRASIKLFEEHCYPVAAPGLAQRIGPGGPERFLEHPLLHDSNAGGWRAWFATHDIDYRPQRRDRRFEDYNLVLAAAMNGLGIALARPPLVVEALRSGRLVPVDERTALNPVAYWLDRPPGPLRRSAETLARRLLAEAGVPEGQARAFLG
ncbi:MAG TPA: LysR family transcriptional regulator [Beijerinckiaceae bacterium]|jgi:DNA-binding transcriptional LysR family regulator